MVNNLGSVGGATVFHGTRLTRQLDRDNLPIMGLNGPGGFGRHEGTADFGNLSTIDESRIRRYGATITAILLGAVDLAPDAERAAAAGKQVVAALRRRRLPGIRRAIPEALAELRPRLQSAVKNLKSSLKGNDLGAIRDDTEALMTVNQTITTRLYSEAASSDGSDGGGSFDVDDEVARREALEDVARNDAPERLRAPCRSRGEKDYSRVIAAAHFLLDHLEEVFGFVLVFELLLVLRAVDGTPIDTAVGVSHNRAGREMAGAKLDQVFVSN